MSGVKRAVTAARATSFLRRVQKGITASADALTHVDEERLLLPQTRQLVGRVLTKGLSALVVKWSSAAAFGTMTASC